MIETGVFDDVNKLCPLEAQRSKSLDVVLEEEEQAMLRQRSGSNSLFGKLFKTRRQVSKYIFCSCCLSSSLCSFDTFFIKFFYFSFYFGSSKFSSPHF